MTRLVLGAMLLTAKFYNDVYYSNKQLADLSGVTLIDLNAIELFFLRTIDYSVYIDPLEYERIEFGLQIHSNS